MLAKQYRCVAQRGATFRAEGQVKAFYYAKDEVVDYMPGIEKNHNFQPVGQTQAVNADFQVGSGVDPKELAKITKDQLVLFASKKNVPIDPQGTKAQIFNEIAEAVNKLDSNRTSEVVLQELLTFVQTFEKAK